MPHHAAVPEIAALDQTLSNKYVEALVASDSGYGQKPNPGPLLACAWELEVPPIRCVYVGDHSVDVQTARSAGIPT
jgi:phosphoglycolate phosphatase